MFTFFFFKTVYIFIFIIKITIINTFYYVLNLLSFENRSFHFLQHFYFYLQNEMYYLFVFWPLCLGMNFSSDSTQFHVFSAYHLFRFNYFIINLLLFFMLLKLLKHFFIEKLYFLLSRTSY